MPTDQILKMLRTLSARQLWTMGTVVALFAAGMYGFLYWQKDASFRPLYNGLSAEDAASVMQKLKEGGVPYKIAASGGTISVPEDRVAELRLEMAGAGLPKNGRIGFELFDKTNFGMTDFAEHINYRRALEGELERSVMSVNEIEQARVHISLPQESVFLDSKQPAKASVLVKTRTGATLPDTAIPAIANLVASAVEGLQPENVSILDMRGNLLNKPKRPLSEEDSSSAALEYRHRVEQDLLAKIDSTLEPVAGAGRFRAAVSADTDLNSGEQSEEVFDPTRSVMVSSQKTEDVSNQTRAASGVPGTASNLPDTNPKPNPAGSTTSRKTENINYQTSHTIKRTVLPQGSIRRLSLSVLLDYDVHFEGAKRVLTAPSADRVKVIHDLVAAAAGISTERGDQLIVESLPFESTMNLEQPTAAPAGGPAKKLTPIEQLKSDPKMMIGLAAILAIVLAGGIFAIFKMKGAKNGPAAAQAAQALPPAAEAQARPAGIRTETALGPGPNIPSLSPSRVETLATQLRATAQKNSEVCVGVLRGWMKEEKA